MTTTTSIPNSRIERGIRLAAERADEFERVGTWTWIVPGNDRESYTVDLRHSYCTCACFQNRRSKLNRKPEPCKHVYASEVVSSQRKMARQRDKTNITGGGFLCGEGETP